MARLKTSDGLLGACAAAEFLKLNRSTVRFWRTKGALVPTAVAKGPRGVLYKYSKADLERFRERISYT